MTQASARTVEEIWTPEYLVDESLTRIRMLGDYDVTKVLGINPRYENLKGWILEIPDLTKTSGEEIHIKVYHPVLQKERTIRIPVNQKILAEKNFFSSMKLSGKMILPKNSLDDIGKGWQQSLHFDEAMAASILFHTPSSEILKNADAFLDLVDHARYANRLHHVLRGDIPLQHVEVLTGRKGIGLSWKKLARRTKADPDFVQITNRGGIRLGRIRENREFNQISADEGMDVFLSQLRDSHGEHYGMSFSIERQNGETLNYQYLNTGKMHEIRERVGVSPEMIPAQWGGAPRAIREYLENSYQERLNLTPNQLKKLMRISEAMENRTDYIFITNEPGMKEVVNPEVLSFDFAQKKLVKTSKRIQEEFEQFQVRGTMSLVYAEPHEALPLEIFTGVKIKRPSNGKVVEIGRFTVDPELRPLGPKQIWKSAAMVASRKDVAKICAETTKEYAQELIENFGFKKVAERLNFENKPEYIIEVTPAEFFAHAVLSKQR